ncbi:MAG: LptF/LptG family permease, partial [Gammaproteobacteria bacterium]|nr:LptF/LptG family permease [Gammaproteobacteria bacterium]
MLIINKYLIREVFTTLLAVTTVLLLIFISGQLTGLFSKAASGSLPVDTIMALLGLKSISNL